MKTTNRIPKWCAAIVLGLCAAGQPAAGPSAPSVEAAAPPKLGSHHVLKKLQLKDSRVVDAAQLLAEMTGANIVTTSEAGKKTVTLYLQGVTTQKAIEILCKISGLWYRKEVDSDIYRIMTTQEYQKDIVVFKAAYTTRTFTLLNQNVISAASAIADLFGDRVVLSLGTPGEDLGSGGGGLGTGFGPGSGIGAGGAGGARVLGGGGLGGAGFAAGRGRGTGGFPGVSAGGGFGRGALSRAGGGAFQFNLGREGGGLNRPLTSDQIANLASAAAIQQPGAGVPSKALEDVTGQASPIFVTVNRQHNLLIMRTSDVDVLDEIGNLIDEIDRPTPQVLLEMKILELTLGDTFQSSFDYEYVTGKNTGGTPSSQVVNPLNTGLPQANRNVVGAGKFPLEDSRLVYQFLSNRIRARIQLLASENRIEEIATPMILAANNRSTRIFIGEERVLTTGVTTSLTTPSTGATTSTITPVTEVRDIGNTVLILPRINDDKTVTLTITQDSSSVAPDAATIPVAGGGGSVQGFNVDTVNTTRLQGTVIATNNLTVAIGGLIRYRKSNNRQKIPLLGDIPVLGFLFRRDVREKIKTELVLLITPRVMRSPGEGREVTASHLEKLSVDPRLPD